MNIEELYSDLKEKHAELKRLHKIELTALNVKNGILLSQISELKDDLVGLQIDNKVQSISLKQAMGDREYLRKKLADLPNKDKEHKELFKKYHSLLAHARSKGCAPSTYYDVTENGESEQETKDRYARKFNNA